MEQLTSHTRAGRHECQLYFTYSRALFVINFIVLPTLPSPSSTVGWVGVTGIDPVCSHGNIEIVVFCSFKKNRSIHYPQRHDFLILNMLNITLFVGFLKALNILH